MLTSSSKQVAGMLRGKGLLRESAFIAGHWREAAQTIPVFDPATEELIGSVPDVGAAGTEDAVAAAKSAYPGWKSLTAQARGSLLRAWADLMTSHRSDLATLMVLEQGKPFQEAAAEVDYAASFVYWFCEEAARAYGDVIPGHREGFGLTVQREPVGVAVAVTPWNFPLAMITRKAAPALAAGCPMIVKPSELTPFSALALAKLASEAGIPAGVFSVVTGQPEPIGRVFTDHPDIRKFSFTGSTRVGAALAARCMASVKRVSLELGGNAPFFVFDDADLDAAADGLMASKFRNAGQTCVCANRIYVQRPVYDRFLKAATERVAQLKVGSGLQEGVTQGPLIDRRAVEKVSRHVEDALASGGRLCLGGKAKDGPGHFFEPTLIADVSPDALVCREETFGPLAAIVPFDTEEEAIELANGTQAGLAAYFFSEGHRRIRRVSDALQSGMVGVNTGAISTAVAPFGGVKQSGIGREGSKYGIDEYLELKLVCDAYASSR